MPRATVDSLRENDEVVEFYLVSSPSVRQTKSDKNYLCLTVNDKTSEMEARVWDIPKGMDPLSIADGKVIKVKGTVSTYNGKLQMNISQIRLAQPDEYDISDFVRRSEYDSNDMMNQVRELLVANVSGPMLELCVTMMDRYEYELLNAPAAINVHHGYIGGLLEHSLSMMRVANMLSDHYVLRKELMLPACLFHDIGKIKELAFGITTSYTTEGTLLGHISIGMMMVSEESKQIEGFTDRLRMEILHMIASHHGLLAYGSPKVPLMREAIVFNSIDNMDAKLGVCAEAVRKDKSDNEVTDYNKYLEGPLYKPFIVKKETSPIEEAVQGFLTETDDA